MGELHTYKRRVTEAQAICWDGDRDAMIAAGVVIDPDGDGTRLYVAKHDEWAQIDLGDWAIRELDGTGWYPCRADVFDATYIGPGVDVEDEPGELRVQVDRLADYIMGNVDGEPSRPEGAIDTAIRLIHELIGLRSEVKAHGGDLVYGEFVLRDNTISPVMVDWTPATTARDADEQTG